MKYKNICLTITNFANRGAKSVCVQPLQMLFLQTAIM